MSERRELGHFLLFFFPRPNSDIIEVKKRKWFPKAANIGRRVPGALSADVSTKVLGVFYIWHGARRGEMHKVQIVSFDIISLAVRVWSISCLIDFFFLSFADLFFGRGVHTRIPAALKTREWKCGMVYAPVSLHHMWTRRRRAGGYICTQSAKICTLGRVEIV